VFSVTCRIVRAQLVVASIVAAVFGATVGAQQTADFEPTMGQKGKDVVWVPTPQILVEKMLDMADVTPNDFVMDLGSGDGRNVIGAAKRGARALGVEFNPDMVELSRRNAAREGVGDRATFVQGDMFEADVSEATVLALFLLPANLSRLRDTFLDMRAGTRIVANTFGFQDWDADETQHVEGDCTSWCTSLLFIVPAKVAGLWRWPDGQLWLDQSAQIISGTLTMGGGTAVVAGRLRGERVRFMANDTEYAGRVVRDRMELSATINGVGQDWTVTRSPSQQ
jgi:SAM-dependent methyltransferase